MSMREKMAKAMHDAFMEDRWDDLPPDGIERAAWLKAADAGLDSLMEPTEEFIGIICGFFMIRRSELPAVWSGFIQEIKEGK